VIRSIRNVSASMWVSAVAAGALAVCSETIYAATACQLLLVAELPVTMADYAPLIPASIDGHTVQMLADTGAARSLIWRSAAKELGLEIRQGGVTFYGAGGHDEGGIVWVDDFALAGAAIHNARLYAAGRGNSPGESAGILGEDFLSAWDIEFDLSAGKIRLFTPKNCKGDDVAYWASAYSVVDLLTAPGDSKWLEAKVQLDGHDVVAMFDSGASTSVVTTQAVLQSGIKTETAATETAASKGIAGKAMDTSVALFKTLSVGDETVRNVELRIADLFSKNTSMQTGSHLAQHVTNDPEMLIGADFFLSHRIYVARSQGKMYFTYKGGPIFRHKPPEAAAPAAAAPP
jgi:predicted aspartyl protease